MYDEMKNWSDEQLVEEDPTNLFKDVGEISRSLVKAKDLIASLEKEIKSKNDLLEKVNGDVVNLKTRREIIEEQFEKTKRLNEDKKKMKRIIKR